MSFSTKCVPWIETTACSDSMSENYAIMSKVFFVTTCIIGIFFEISVFRRTIYFKNNNNLFNVIAPQLMFWAPLQIFYLTLHAFSSNNFNVPPVLITISNLLSSMILGNTIPQLIVTWMEIKTKTKTTKMIRYQKHYWISIGIFTLLCTIAAIVTGINSNLYFIGMRIILSLWTLYLIVCCIMFFYLGIKMYYLTEPFNTPTKAIPILTKNSSIESITMSQSSSYSNETTRAHISVLIMMIILGLIIFVPVIFGFILYAIYLETVETSNWLPLFVWGFFNSGSSLFVLFWGIYFLD